MHPTVRMLIPISVFLTLTVAVTIALLQVSKKGQVKSTSGNIIPSPPPKSKLKTVTQTLPSAPCLPTSEQFTGLRECSSQNDCSTCSETPTSCVAVDSLARPVQVSVALPPSDLECSGHGTRNAEGQCVCDGDRQDGVCTSDACFRGESCEFGEFTVASTGQYCLPAYLGKCNEFTSDTVLSVDSQGRTTWTCRCKQSMAGVFTQSVEGGDCDIQVACGAPVGVQAYVNKGSLDNPMFEMDTVYPNRLTSHLDKVHGSEPCVYKTVKQPDRRDRDGTVHRGQVWPDPDADPTCIPRLYSNKCTVSTGGGNTQVIRGSGMPGDPEIQRVSPPFYTPVPPQLNTCPDGWTGEGTRANPCTDGTTHFSIFEAGEWLRPDITSVAELRAWWASQSDSPWWGVNRVPISDVNCMESIFEQGSFATAEHPDSLFCEGECTAGRGVRKRAWEGASDGPLVDEHGNPNWVSGGEYGGQCTCDSSQVSQLTNTPDTWWTCGTDMCSTSPGSTFNETTQACDCRPVSDEYPYKTSMSYKHPNVPPTCVSDPCNPSGVNSSAAQVACTSESDCGGLCRDNRCYIPSNTACRTDLDCSNQLVGLSQDVAKCMNINDVTGLGTCATLDIQRARMGSTCTTDENCSLGACTGEEGSKTCTGGCACKNGFVQVSDGGMSPLGAMCVDTCIGKCKNGGMCRILPDGGTACVCPPYYGGETCETQLCARKNEYCDSDHMCCSECRCDDDDDAAECCNRFPLEGSLTCVNNACVPKSSVHKLVSGVACKDSAGVCKPAWWHTPTPPDCSGWGYKEDGKCVCLPNRGGVECEFPVCSSVGDTCVTNRDCCNRCDCTNTEMGCCPQFDPHYSRQTCQGGV